MQNKTCSFTGHRPSGLPWGYREKGKEFRKFKKELISEIEKAILSGYKFFISGMAMGVDLISAEIILKLKKKHTYIKLECALPCLNQTNGWHKSFIKRYNKVLKYADKITYVSNSNYYNGCMQKRNRYLVDNSNLLIAVSNNTVKGGTYQTISYAKNKGNKIIILKV